jgi:quinol-cytochrome oxidoreductase complex cytochrome b subunit
MMFIRTSHRVSAFVFVVLAVLTGIAAIVASRSRWATAALSGCGVLLALALLVSGYFLPWDQLGLWAVTVGTNLEGYSIVFQDNVKFIALNGHTFGPDVFQRWFIVHAIALPLVIICSALALVLISRRRGRRALRRPA